MRQMQEHYERLLHKAKDELYMLRKRLDGAHQKMLRMQNWYVYCKKKKVYSLSYSKMEKRTVVGSYMIDQLMCRCEEKAMEAEELKQQLNSAKASGEGAQEGRHWSDEEERQLRDETEFLKRSLNVERRKSANYELQVCEMSQWKCHHTNEESCPLNM